MLGDIPQQSFSFAEICSTLLHTSAYYLGTNPPLPYARPAGRYEAAVTPRTIHFIWIGSSLPHKYIPNIEGFATVNPAYTIVLWTDHKCNPIAGVQLRTIAPERLINRDIYERANNIAVQTDLLRMEIVLEHGGLYSDVDAIALRPLSTIFTRPFLAYEPHKWKDVTNAVFGFPRNDPFLMGCVDNLKEHFRWIASKRRVLLQPNPDNVACLCGNYYIMSQLFTWADLDELTFISQDYLVTDTGIGFSVHTMDATWIKSLECTNSLYEEDSTEVTRKISNAIRRLRRFAGFDLRHSRRW